MSKVEKIYCSICGETIPYVKKSFSKDMDRHNLTQVHKDALKIYNNVNIIERTDDKGRYNLIFTTKHNRLLAGPNASRTSFYANKDKPFEEMLSIPSVLFIVDYLKDKRRQKLKNKEIMINYFGALGWSTVSRDGYVQANTVTRHNFPLAYRSIYAVSITVMR